MPLAWPTALILLASSSTMLTFQLRPFSNSLEAILLATLLVVWKKSFHASEVGICGLLNIFTADIIVLAVGRSLSELHRCYRAFGNFQQDNVPRILCSNRLRSLGSHLPLYILPWACNSAIVSGVAGLRHCSYRKHSRRIGFMVLP